ncbi:TPA: hypothetical protein J1184_004540 [Escherichia coli]|uniref:toxin co-regulated pilus biosynthesis Q family protein n=1 Tax=Escherichia coli TaxID=562 RepID=UPI000B42842E|nr:toxin co-regulated pilus biosynthesis Q family protein [Escherichia coli]OWC45046.1 hypothetical protein A8F92_10300 [Escherichia coli]RCP60551.1 hypothetical protein A6574_24855 [Escherichia coli]CAD5781146.1 lipoprotein [Escherichia coli]CAD5794261.1 lipoprotein [Escherichia coli]HAH2772555.1 hypothetical protein [Escherichia coli]
MFIRRAFYSIATIIATAYSFNVYASTNIVSPYSDLLPTKEETVKDSFIKTVNSVKKLNNWSVYKGQTLNNVLAQWANVAGWDLVWDSSQTYKLNAAASFGNVSFEQAVQNLFDAIGNTDPRLYVTLYKKNRVILVSSKPGF